MITGLYYLSLHVSFPAILIRRLDDEVLIVYFNEVEGVRRTCATSDTPAANTFVEDA